MTDEGCNVEAVAEEQTREGEDTAKDVDRHKDQGDADDLFELVDLDVFWPDTF